MAEETTASWYIVHTQTGREAKVQERILLDVKTFHFEDRILQVIVPTEDVLEMKQDGKISRKRKFFPGYVFIQMKMTSEAYWFIRKITGVAGFLGDPHPVPLSEEEIADILDRVNNQDGKPKYLVEFKRGESVRITEGPFKHFIGVVEEVNEQKNKLKVMVTVFDRTAPVELDFLQVEKN